MSNLKDRTFGIEIECFLNNVTRADFTDRFNQLPEIDKGGMKIKYNGRYGQWYPSAWSMGYDGTVTSHRSSENHACELTSNPIKYSDLENVKKVIDFLNLNGASVNKSCGFHCHIDAKDLTLSEVKKVLVTYLIYEEVIAFTQPSSRRLSSQWCSSVRNNGNVNGSSSSLDSAFHNATTNDLITKIKKAKTFKDLFFVFNVYDPRYLKCNIKGLYKYHQEQANPGSVRNPGDATGTIEFRQHSGTTDWEKISNWVNFCYQIVESSRFAKCDAKQGDTHISFERKKRMLFEKIRRRLIKAFSSKEEFNQHWISSRYTNARKFLVKRITHFTNNGASVAESDLINRTNLNREERNV